MWTLSRAQILLVSPTICYIPSFLSHYLFQVALCISQVMFDDKSMSTGSQFMFQNHQTNGCFASLQKETSSPAFDEYYSNVFSFFVISASFPVANIVKISWLLLFHSHIDIAGVLLSYHFLLIQGQLPQKGWLRGAMHWCLIYIKTTLCRVIVRFVAYSSKMSHSILKIYTGEYFTGYWQQGCLQESNASCVSVPKNAFSYLFEGVCGNRGTLTYTRVHRRE